MDLAEKQGEHVIVTASSRQTYANYQSLDVAHLFVLRQSQTAMSTLAIKYPLGVVPRTALETLDEGV